MSIPHDDVIQNELLGLLYKAPKGTMHCNDVYDQLAELFPELTDDELNLPYRESKSKWANRVQFARLHCVNDGHIFDFPSGKGKGYWTITDEGRRYVKNRPSKMMRTPVTSNQIKNNLGHNFSEEQNQKEEQWILERVEKRRQQEAEEQRLKELEEKRLKEIETVVEIDLDSLRIEEEYFEGQQRERFTNYYERDSKLRAKAIAIHGTKCLVCGFDFEERYGEQGKGFIEVHHLKPVSELGGNTKVNPKTDMVVVCSNCHKMIHRKRDSVLSIEELKSMYKAG